MKGILMQEHQHLLRSIYVLTLNLYAVECYRKLYTVREIWKITSSPVQESIQVFLLQKGLLNRDEQTSDYDLKDKKVKGCVNRKELSGR